MYHRPHGRGDPSGSVDGQNLSTLVDVPCGKTSDGIGRGTDDLSNSKVSRCTSHVTYGTHDSVKVFRVTLSLDESHTSSGTTSQVVFLVNGLLVILLSQALGRLVAELEGAESKVELGVGVVEGPGTVDGIALVA